MKKIFSLLALLITLFGTAQIVEPVKWSSNVVKVSDTELDLIITADIDDEWHLYSQFTPEGGPIPLVFTYKNQKGNYQLIGKTKEGKYKKSYNDIFELDEYYFLGVAKFTQRVKILNPKLKTIDVLADGQACIDGKCTQTTSNLKFKLPELKIAETVDAAAVDTSSTSTDSVAPTNTDTVKKAAAPIKDTNVDKPEDKKDKSLWTLFILSFLGGFAAILMPCIFPMIPMTVSFFTKQSKSRAEGIKNAIIYGLSIIVIYVLLGSLITAIFGAEALNELSTSATFNLIFFGLLVVFAMSFLGAFEIMLPSSWATKLDSQADKGGMIGIIFMALALAVVSFSCTGPIVGTLLVESSRNGGIAPVVGMFGFSLAIALPFMLFAMFPGWLNSMPKSGGWLNTVKVSLGFLELAFAFKFLSNADLAYQKHLLERELFIAIWIAIFAAWALYLFGKYMLPHDYEKADKIGVGRLIMAILVTTFTLYMIPGLWGAPLKILSGLTPPSTYSEIPNGIGGNHSNAKIDLPEHAHQGPHGIIAFDDYEIGLAYAKKVNKPVLLDFTGDNCANCRLMEDKVWSDSKILPIIKEKVVLISLYCDRKIELPKEQQYVSKTGKEIVTIGNKWTDFQITRYNSNSQPLYVILNNDGEDASKPIAYTTDIQEYKKWLEDGIAAATKK
ncbi:protein-disulfide reductase DsbD family protein [Flavobacterium urocaniciphilum]|uniref:Thiol:disulfide interchange protein DsbD n=1 Tax=Flavobacterium urocaniciphilum TaxID=1299341 RepID=A0A1H8Z4H5_9FLAO|nr:thioredoxin family protein [Flavobacterium urocaniciphilum]SEP59320.1 Thiol:disulfide interchange protein DsbD [Flavobacterium urocaniciphilum]